MTTTGGQLRRLTSLRWFAALFVFAAHSKLLGPLAGLRFVGPPGETGVAFFFALSGLVLTWSAPAGQTAREFYRRRFARIYPATVVSGLLAAALIAAGVEGMGSTGPSPAIADLFVVQAWSPSAYWVHSYNPVTWSLSCEAFFYLTLPVLLRIVADWPARRLIASAVGGLLTSLIVGTALLYGHGGVWASILVVGSNPLLRFPEFFAGVVLGLLLRRGWVPQIGLLAGGVVFAAAWAIASTLHDSLPFAVLLAPGTLTLLAAAAGADLRGQPGRILTTRWAVYLGEVSFCFYLMHFMVLATLHQWLTGAPWVIVGLGVSVAAAITLHHLVELPMQRRIRLTRPIQSGMPQPRHPVGAATVQTST